MKEIDYYSVLNVRRDATIEEIALAYRKLAVQYHPHKDKAQCIPNSQIEINHLPGLPPAAMWGYVNKAYDILSHPLRRQVYDTYGEEGLQKGVPLPNFYFQPYIYHENYIKTYEDVFGCNSPYGDIIDAITNPPPLYSTEEGSGIKVQDKPIEKILPLDLKEIYTGAAKRMKILRHEFIENSPSQTEIREKILIVPIQPGTYTGSRIVFKQQGDRGVSRIPADIIFITADKPHDVFTRRFSDLYMTHEIDLKQALCGFKLTINTIDDRKLSISITDCVHPNYVKKIKYEGLPLPSIGNQQKIQEKGDLYIQFSIKFPLFVPKDLKLDICNIMNKLNATILERTKNEDIEKMSKSHTSVNF